MRHFKILLLGFFFVTRVHSAVVLVEAEDPAWRRSPVAGDASLWLRDQTALDGARIGGHGTDPVIRGMQQDSIRVSIDGACVTSGCPNRMDPATSYVSLDHFDNVQIRRGVTTLEDGPGAPGGSVMLRRDTARFTKEDPFRGRVGSSYFSNSDTWSAWADLAAGTPDAFGRGQFQWQDAGNYRDGDGTEVRSGFSQIGGGFTAGWTPDDDTRLEAGFDVTRTEDALFAGAGMDSPESESRTLRLNGSRRFSSGHLSALRFTTAVNHVEHLMDNYSLRPVGRMKMRAPSDTTTWVGTIAADIDLDPVLWTWGTNWRLIHQHAERWMGPAAGGHPTTLQSSLWPDAQNDTFGFFTEARWEITPALSLKGGVRVDHTTTEIGDANRVGATLGGINTPAGLYRRYYGTSDTTRSETHVGALLRAEWMFDDAGSMLYASGSRAVRTPDVTERYMASNNAVAANRWVGNPSLNSEIHHQLEAGADWRIGTFRLRPGMFIGWVEDYILRDRADGSGGVLVADGAAIYRNVNARRWGAELDAEVVWFDHLKLFGGLSFVETTNSSDDRPLPLTPPLTGRVGVEWNDNRWGVGALVTMADTQDRLDLSSPLEVGQTSGWATLDLYASVRPWQFVVWRGGISNITDHTYARHLNRSDVFNNQAVQINEPGRTFWTSLSLEF